MMAPGPLQYLPLALAKEPPRSAWASPVDAGRLLPGPVDLGEPLGDLGISFKKVLKKVARVVAPVLRYAAPLAAFIPGVGPLAAAGIAAAASATGKIARSYAKTGKPFRDFHKPLKVFVEVGAAAAGAAALSYAKPGLLALGKKALTFVHPPAQQRTIEQLEREAEAKAFEAAQVATEQGWLTTAGRLGMDLLRGRGGYYEGGGAATAQPPTPFEVATGIPEGQRVQEALEAYREPAYQAAPAPAPGVFPGEAEAGATVPTEFPEAVSEAGMFGGAGVWVIMAGSAVALLWMMSQPTPKRRGVRR